MRISNKTDYALRALFVLVASPEERAVSAREIADRSKIPRKFLEQILRELKEQGVVQSIPVNMGDTGLRGLRRISPSARWCDISMAFMVPRPARVWIVASGPVPMKAPATSAGFLSIYGTTLRACLTDRRWSRSIASRSPIGARQLLERSSDLRKVLSSRSFYRPRKIPGMSVTQEERDLFD